MSLRAIALTLAKATGVCVAFGVTVAQVTLPFCGASTGSVDNDYEIGKPNSFYEPCYIRGLQNKWTLHVHTDKYQNGVVHTCTETQNDHQCSDQTDTPCPGNTCAPTVNTAPSN